MHIAPVHLYALGKAVACIARWLDGSAEDSDNPSPSDVGMNRPLL